MADELVDIVDGDDVVMRVATRAAMRAERLRHRAVYIAVRSTDGRLLAHRRSLLKDLLPGHWDVAVGGVVAAGEAYDVAAQRELAEEVGIEAVVGGALQPIGDGAFTDEHVDVIGRCYVVVDDGPFTFADGEVIEARWVTPAELDELCAAQPMMPDSVAILLPLLDDWR